MHTVGRVLWRETLKKGGKSEIFCGEGPGLWREN